MMEIAPKNSAEKVEGFVAVLVEERQEAVEDAGATDGWSVRPGWKRRCRALDRLVDFRCRAEGNLPGYFTGGRVEDVLCSGFVGFDRLATQPMGHGGF